MQFSIGSRTTGGNSRRSSNNTCNSDGGHFLRGNSCRRSFSNVGRDMENTTTRLKRLDERYFEGNRSGGIGTSSHLANCSSVPLPVREPSRLQTVQRGRRRILASPITQAFSFAPFFSWDWFKKWGEEFVKNNPPPEGVHVEVVKPEELPQHTIVSPLNTKVHGFSISDFLGVKEKIQQVADAMHQEALLTPDLDDDKIDYLKYLYDDANTAVITRFMPEWFKEIVIFSKALSNEFCHVVVEFVFKKIYELVSKIVLFTPEWMFQNSWFPSVVFKFSILSICIVIAFSMIEGIKRTFKMSHTPLIDTAKKLPIALGVSAAAPLLFAWGVKILNKLTNMILDLTGSEITANTANTTSSLPILFEPFEILIMIGFIGVLIYLCVPLFLFHARRWYDLLMCGLLTPLAMSCWLFESTHYLFQKWYRNILNLGATQLIYAGYISVLGILMFATPVPTTFNAAFVKALVLIGGILHLAYPPQFIREFDVGSGNMFDLFSKGRSKLRKVENVVGKLNKESVGDFLVDQAKHTGVRYRKWQGFFNLFRRK